MKKRISLNEVDEHVMSPKVVMLLSQFAYYIKRHNGIVIKLASKTVLKDVHVAYLTANDYMLNDIYERIVNEIMVNDLKPRTSLISKFAKIAKPNKPKDSEVSTNSVSIYN